MEVTLVIGRRVAGVVRTADGKPAVRARVALEGSRDGDPALADPTRTATDVEGRFALPRREGGGGRSPGG